MITCIWTTRCYNYDPLASQISDFGLSRNLQDEDYYVAKNGLIPLRWTAPEAFQDGKFSTASDVWSYGVVLYEIWSLASKPYGSLINEQVQLPCTIMSYKHSSSLCCYPDYV